MNNELKILYEQINKIILYKRLSNKVDEQPINLHYMKSLKDMIKKIKMCNSTEEQAILIKDAKELLVIKKAPEAEAAKETTHVNNTDLEGAAQDVTSTHEHAVHENDKSHIHDVKVTKAKSDKGAQRHTSSRAKKHDTIGDHNEK